MRTKKIEKILKTYFYYVPLCMLKVTLLAVFSVLYLIIFILGIPFYWNAKFADFISRLGEYADKILDM